MANGKAKGAAFELKIVKLIRNAVKCVYPNDSVCFRTPASGGHYIIGGADITISEDLRKIFPFCIECKHRKTIKVEKFFAVTKHTKEFLKQAVANTYETGDLPLLVMRGARTAIFCASTLEALKDSQYEELSSDSIPGLVFRYRSKTWKIFLFKYMLDILSSKSIQLKKSKKSK